MLIKRSMTMLGAGAALMLPMVSANAGTTDTQQLTDRISQLEAKIAVMESAVPTVEPVNQWLDASRDEEIRAIVYDIMDDSAGRSSLLGDGAVAGWNKGFFLASSDGTFKVKIWGAVQSRFIWDHRDDSGADGDRAGFENRRACFGFKGHVYGKENQFFLWGDFSRSTGAFGLFDAWLKRDLGDGWAVRFGQFKPLVLQEFTNSFKTDMLAERSLINYKYHPGRTQGVELSNTSDQFRFFVAVVDGIRMQNTAWQAEDTEYALMGRIEWMPIGTKWGEWTNAIAFPEAEEQLMFGGGIAHQTGEYGTGLDEMEITRWTLDANYKTDGFSVFAMILGNHSESTTVDTDEYGFVIQSGVFVADDVQIFGRYEWGDADTLTTEDLSIITAGFTKFWHGHGMKWTNDVGFGLNEVTSYYANSATGWQADAAGKDGQIVFRSQFQWGF